MPQTKNNKYTNNVHGYENENHNIVRIRNHCEQSQQNKNCKY